MPLHMSCRLWCCNYLVRDKSCMFRIWLLNSTIHVIFNFRFFHESVSPKPLSIPFVLFQIFLKILWDIRSSMYTTSHHRCRWYRWQICHWCSWHWHHIRHLCHLICHQCHWYWWCTLICEYLCEFFRVLGEDDSWKKPEAKNLVILSLEPPSVLRSYVNKDILKIHLC